MSTKECCVVVLDVGSSMGVPGVGSGLTGLDKAKQALRQLISQKLLFGAKQDEVALVLAGTDATDNNLNQQTGDYEHITELRSLARADLDFLTLVDTINNEDGEADIVDAILVGMEVIVSRVKKLKFAKRIFVITDAAAPIHDQDQMDQIAAEMVAQDLKINIIGIGFQQPEDDDDDSDDDEDGGVKAEAPRDNPDDKRADQTKANESKLRAFADKVQGVVFSAQSAIEMMSEVRKKSNISKRTKLTLNLTIGPLQIPVKTFTKSQQRGLPTLSKESQKAPDYDPEKKVSMQRLYVPKDLDLVANAPAQGAEGEEKSKMYKYGRRTVTVTSANEDELIKLPPPTDEKCLSVIGFTNAKSVERFHSLSAVDVVFADKIDPKKSSTKRTQVMFSAFVNACAILDRVPIVRYNYRNGLNPKLGVLLPKVKADKECFYFHVLPTTEDIRSFPFSSLDELHKPSNTQLHAARNLVDSMDLMEAFEDEDGDLIEALKPKNTYNPVLQRFYQNLEVRALDETAAIQPLDPAVRKYIEFGDEFQERDDVAAAIADFAAAFPFKKIEKAAKAKKKRKNWSDFEEELGDIQLGANKKVKSEDQDNDDDEDDDLDVDFAQAAAGVVSTVSRHKPVADFVAMCGRRDFDLVSEAFTQMWEVAQEKVDSSMGDLQFQTALDCLLAMKQEAIKHQEPGLFNDGLKPLKARYSNKPSPNFWEFVVDKGLMPVVADEDGDSFFTLETAKEFMTSTQAPSASTGLSADLGDSDSDDDLLDDI